MVIDNHRFKGIKIIDEMNKDVEVFLENILDTITDAVCVVDVNCNVVFWNESAETLYEITRDKIYGKKLQGFFPSALLPEIIDTKRKYVNFYHSPKEGSHNLISARPLYNQGDLIGAISYDKDITEQINIAEKLKKTKSNLEVLESEISNISTERYAFDQIVGKNIVFSETIKFTKALSKSKINILLTGESGTGKEVLARAIHIESGRTGYFVPINCSAIPGELLESELFGYEGGAFTGASQKGRIGKFELAHGGTLFLDEIGDMPIEMQAKILRVLEDSEVSKVGSNKSKKVEVRIVAASNKDLQGLIAEGKFRKDLYYRLNGVLVEIMPLRERRDDIPLFIQRFIENMRKDHGNINIEVPKTIGDMLSNYYWEGNIRELKNIVERMVILAKNKGVSVIEEKFIPDVIRLYDSIGAKEPYAVEEIRSLNEIIEDTEVEVIKKALSQTSYNKAKAAKILKIPRSTLYFKMEKYGIK